MIENVQINEKLHGNHMHMLSYLFCKKSLLYDIVFSSFAVCTLNASRLFSKNGRGSFKNFPLVKNLKGQVVSTTNRDLLCQ